MTSGAKYDTSTGFSWYDMSMDINGVERVLQSPVAVSL